MSEEERQCPKCLGSQSFLEISTLYCFPAHLERKTETEERERQRDRERGRERERLVSLSEVKLLTIS